ncbi:MAG: polyprenyl synthetase family protein [Anaerolineae bacterium]|nr:polyprenyl synthetase family protein [Anaerolineae bacterium]
MLREQVDAGLKAVDEKLHSVVRSEVPVLDEASHHIIASGGKRVRPQLVLLSYLAAGGDNLDEAVPLAAAVELIHTATLVHDDINDHSLTRRGKIAVHARWGRTFALLAGDYLFAKVYEMMAPYGARYNKIMAGATVELVEGETLQAAAAKSGKMDRETYKRIISLKTASLFRAAATTGALLTGASDEVVKALDEYAHNLGLTFQIVDDVLDIVGDPEKLGKPVGVDVAQGMGVASVAIQQKNGRKQLDGDSDPYQRLILQLRESGAAEVARAEAYQVAERARTALHVLPPSPARDALESLIDAVLERDR